MNLVVGQPYPDLPAWEDISGILESEWNVNKNGLFLSVYAEGNVVHIMGRVNIGATRTAGILPVRFRPTGFTQGLIALVMKGPSCVVEIRPAGHVNMSEYSLGMTEAEMIQQFKGQQLFFSGSYPRRTPV